MIGVQKPERLGECSFTRGSSSENVFMILLAKEQAHKTERD
jgi:hypothetical protein